MGEPDPRIFQPGALIRHGEAGRQGLYEVLKYEQQRNHGALGGVTHEKLYVLDCKQDCDDPYARTLTFNSKLIRECRLVAPAPSIVVPDRLDHIKHQEVRA